MQRTGNPTVRRAQKESLYYQELSKLFLSILQDDKGLQGIFLTKVKLSDDGGVCYLFFYGPGGLEEFNEKRKTLVLYKASMRKALSSKIAGRYTPELIFKFDDQFEKLERLDNLLDSIKES